MTNKATKRTPKTKAEAAADLKRKAKAGAALLEKGTREAVKVSEVNALLWELSQAENEQEALLNALLTMYNAGANAGAIIERRARRTRETKSIRKTGGTRQ